MIEATKRHFGYDGEGKKSTVESLMRFWARGTEGKQEDAGGAGKHRGRGTMMYQSYDYTRA